MSGNTTQNVLENAKFYDLLTSIQINPKLNELIVDVYARKLASKSIFIGGSELSKEVTIDVLESDSQISIRDFDLVKLALRKFGHKMKALAISYDGIESHQREEIHHLIDQYCSRSITEMILMQMDQNVLKLFSNPLKTIEYLTIDGELKAQRNTFLKGLFGRRLLKLNEIFPNLRHLSLNNMNIPDKKLLDVNFPQLEHVKIVLVPAPSRRYVRLFLDRSKPAMENLFIKNPQIKQLNLRNVNSLDFLRIANKLPNLNWLQITFFALQKRYSGHVIQFKTVKKLELNIRADINLDKIVRFDQVEELILHRNGKLAQEFPIQNAPHLKKLNIIGYPFHGRAFIQLDKKAPNLKDVIISSSSTLKVEDIAKFAKENKELEKLRLINIDQNLPGNLTKHLNDGWTVTQTDFILTIQKKN